MLVLLSLVACMDYSILGEDSPDRLGLGPGAGQSQDTGDWDTGEPDDEGGGTNGGGSNGGGNSGGGNSGGGNSGGGNNSGSGGGNSGGGGSSGGGSTDPEPGETESNPRDPVRGDVVITELMVDPDAVSDADGEWVELYNASSDWLDLSGHELADDNVDTYVIDAVSSNSLVVGPGEYLVICANDDRWDNGGATCHGTVLYQTWGEGFALSNTGDEVLLVSPAGRTLDRVEYGDEWAPVGESMGVDRDYATVSGNDDTEGEWCTQFSTMASGDAGNPGSRNDWCF